jgi:sensor histidine kinase regulating citrate/malate metabolism
MSRLDAIYAACLIVALGILVWVFWNDTELERERLALDERALAVAREIALAKLTPAPPRAKRGAAAKAVAADE